MGHGRTRHHAKLNHDIYLHLKKIAMMMLGILPLMPRHCSAHGSPLLAPAVNLPLPPLANASVKLHHIDKGGCSGADDHLEVQSQKGLFVLFNSRKVVLKLR